MYRKTYAQVNLDNLKNNLNQIISNSNYQYYFGVVKSNCYGHGNYIIKTMLVNGINYLAVSSLDEAMLIREDYKDVPILCLEPVHIEELEICSKNNITIIVSDIDYFNQLIKTKHFLKVHLKIDSGMNRLGFKDKSEIKLVFDKLINKKNIELEGIFTHFASNGILDTLYQNQVKKFLELTSLIDLNKIKIIHLDKSTSGFFHNKLSFSNGIRLGMIMYGYVFYPPKINSFRGKLRGLYQVLYKKKNNIVESHNINFSLKPLLSLHTEVISIKKVFPGESLGYYPGPVIDQEKIIAILPIGYADGFFKKSTGVNVLINSNKYKTIGTICMNMTFVEVDEKVKVGDMVTLFGDKIRLVDLTNHAEITVYEALAMLSPLLPRVYYENNEIVKTK